MQMLSTIESITGYIFQQENALVHLACEDITSDFIAPNLWLPNSSVFKPVDHKIWSIMQQRV